MCKYIAKRTMVEAWQWNGERPLIFPLIGNWDNNPMTPEQVSIETLAGYVDVCEGDFIIKGLTGDYYPCKPDIFKLTYEKEGE